jgi:peptide/nickel transport system substrate-binding protein
MSGRNRQPNRTARKEEPCRAPSRVSAAPSPPGCRRPGAGALAATVVAGAQLSAPRSLRFPGGAANIAMIGEPQTLDPMSLTADLVGTIMQHVYELLYTYDANSNVVPMLAESMPAVSGNGLV